MVQLYLEELYYRFWHHKLGRECVCTDIDFVEYRITNNVPQILGLFEIKTSLSSTTRAGLPLQTQVEMLIADKLDSPLWRVVFDRDLKMFELERLDIATPSLTLTEKEFVQFHRKRLRQL